MKKLLFIFVVVCLCHAARSQNVTACNNALNICPNPDFIFLANSGTGLPAALNVSNPTTNPQSGNGSNPNAAANSGCLLSNGPGPQWLIVSVISAGSLGFIFGDPSGPNPQAGLYDWAMWPYSASACADLFNNTLPPVACNWNAVSTGGTGMGTPPPTGNAGNYQPSIPVTAGQQFLILISNYSNINTMVSFESTGTAGLICGLGPTVCAGASATLTTPGYNFATGASFTLMPGGATNTTGIFAITPQSTTSYTVHCTGTSSQNTQIDQYNVTTVFVTPQPVLAPTFTQATCSNSFNAVDLHLTFLPAGQSSSFAVSWSGGPGAIASYSQSSASGLVPGAYTATVLAGNCSAVTAFTMSSPNDAAFTLVPAATVFSVSCMAPQFVLQASNAVLSYSWTGSSGQSVSGSSVSIDSTAIGNWTVLAANLTSGSGCTETHTFTVQNSTIPCTGIHAVMDEEELLRFYPDPNPGEFSVDLNTDVTQAGLRISNTLGQLVYEQSVQRGENRIVIPGLSPGMYYLAVFTGNKQPVATKKMMIGDR